MAEISPIPGSGGTWTPPSTPNQDLRAKLGLGVPRPQPVPPIKTVPGYADGTSNVKVGGLDAKSEVPSQVDIGTLVNNALQSIAPKFKDEQPMAAQPVPAVTAASAPAQAAQVVQPPAGPIGAHVTGENQGPYRAATREQIAQYGSGPPLTYAQMPHPLTHSFEEAHAALSKMPFAQVQQYMAMLPRPQAIDPMTQMHSQMLGLVDQEHNAKLAQQAVFDKLHGVSEEDHNKNMLDLGVKRLAALQSLATQNLPQLTIGQQMQQLQNQGQ